MAEQKKLGPNVTYTNPDKTSKLMAVGDVLLKEGESVNLVEKLGEARARPILEKLARNRYFKVDGAEEPKPEQGSTNVALSGDSTVAMALREEARIRKEQGDEAADAYVQGLDEQGQSKPEDQPAKGRSRQSEPPPEVQTPSEPTLETPPRRRP
jgi:hypothetical protein